MFRPRVETPLVITFPREGTRLNAIHSLFCPEFDAVFVNTQGNVVDVVKVKPYTPAVVPRSPAALVIEAPPGSAKRKGIKPGARISLEDALR